MTTSFFGRPTLARVFVLTTLAVAGAVGATFYGFAESSRRSILERSDALRAVEAARVDARLSSELAIASNILEDVERAAQFGALAADDVDAVEARLFTELLDHPTVSDATLTRAAITGFDAGGDAQLATEGRWQISVFRATADLESEIDTRRVSRQEGSFAAYVRRRGRGGSFNDAPFEHERAAADPTSHVTFRTTVLQRYYGKAIWSDLSFSELDAALPQVERRVVVTVQKALEDAPGHFAGVLRVGLLARTIDALPRRASDDGAERVFLCDSEGRLVARLEPGDGLRVMGDDLRVAPAHLPPEVAAALSAPGRSRSFYVNGMAYLVTYRPLHNSQGWLVGVVAPEDYYTQDLRWMRDRFLVAFALATIIVLGAGGFVLGQLRRSLGRVVEATARMRRFDLSPAPVDMGLRDVAEVMEGVERAKTSMRALGKYVPIELVREFYAENREPELGGELGDLSLLFTDIEGFTSLSEKLQPDALARVLGHYLEAMAAAVRSTGGTVDKFIGDAVMAFWNAPSPVPHHARKACEGALACVRATRELYASEAWRGLAPLNTRFGLHTARVMVGHFGAPERLNYTALGDGVNLAARLEGLCKQYGVTLLASESTVRAAGEDLAFRMLDKVAVKGKKEWVRVYELLGARSECDEALARARHYEQALEAYFARDFRRARGLLATMSDDPPSRVLSARCETMLMHPPADDWNGVYVSPSK